MKSKIFEIVLEILNFEIISLKITPVITDMYAPDMHRAQDKQKLVSRSPQYRAMSYK